MPNLYSAHYLQIPRALPLSSHARVPPPRFHQLFDQRSTLYRYRISPALYPIEGLDLYDILDDDRGICWRQMENIRNRVRYEALSRWNCRGTREAKPEKPSIRGFRVSSSRAGLRPRPSNNSNSPTSPPMTPFDPSETLASWKGHFLAAYYMEGSGCGSVYRRSSLSGCRGLSVKSARDVGVNRSH